MSSDISRNWTDEYAEKRSAFEFFSKKLSSLLADLLDADGISIHLLEARAKTVKSFEAKYSKSSKNYSNPLNQITDLCGLRIVAYYQDDTDRIAEIIKREFVVDEKNSTDREPAPAEFGYRSNHYIVKLDSNRVALKEWAKFEGLKAEIQVRTVLQHAWAAISHKLQYKREGDVPLKLRRKLFRLSALFELSDDEFISLRNGAEAIASDVDSNLSVGINSVDIDLVSIYQYVAKSAALESLERMAADLGFIIEPYGDADISDLVKFCDIFDLKTLGALDSIITSALVWSKDFFEIQYRKQAYTQGQDDASYDFNWHISRAFICQLLIIENRISIITTAKLIRQGWDVNIAKAVLSNTRYFLSKQKELKVASGSIAAPE